MNEIFTTIGIDAAHRVPLHQSRCKNWHGHRYTITAEMSGELYTSGPQTGMVMDFSFLKELMMKHIDETCDHGSILTLSDYKFIGIAFESLEGDFLSWHTKVAAAISANGFWKGQTVFGKTYIIADVPTAENLAKHWFERMAPDVLKATNGRIISAIGTSRPSQPNGVSTGSSSRNYGFSKIESGF